MLQVLTILGQVFVATLFGSMAFFSCVVAPLVFVKLEKETAAGFLRALFPRYHLVVLLLSLAAAVALAPVLPPHAAAMAAIGAGALVSRQIILPRANRHRERKQRGDEAAGRAFHRLHRLSVLINAAQLIGALAVLTLLAAR